MYRKLCGSNFSIVVTVDPYRSARENTTPTIPCHTDLSLATACLSKNAVRSALTALHLIRDNISPTLHSNQAENCKFRLALVFLFFFHLYLTRLNLQQWKPSKCSILNARALVTVSGKQSIKCSIWIFFRFLRFMTCLSNTEFSVLASHFLMRKGEWSPERCVEKLLNAKRRRLAI